MSLIRKFHKYFALVLGVFLFIWLVSGIMMMLPGPKTPGLVPEKTSRLEVPAGAVAPGLLVRKLEAQLGHAVEVSKIVLRPLRGRPVYEIHAANTPMTMWDSVTGDRVAVTAALAERIARDRLQGNVGKAVVERLDRRTYAYSFGDLPAYRVAFESGSGAIAYVSARTGSVRFTSRAQQAWGAVTGLHEFGPLNYLAGGRINRMALLLVGALCLVIVGTGYYLEFFPRSKGRGGA